jgi:hypothetical protein
MKKKSKPERRLCDDDWFEGAAARGRSLNPELELFTVPVAGFERQLVTHIHLAYVSFVMRGILTRDVADGGNRDARLSAAATALSFITEEEFASPLFAGLRRSLSDTIY